MRIKLCILLASFSMAAFGQNETIGLLHHDANTNDGYTLFTPRLSNSVFLIDNCGERVHEWQFNEFPGMTCYLLDNGNLMRAGNDSVTVKDWNNTTLWSFAYSDVGASQHHDIEPLPNGNVLILSRDNLTPLDAINLGRDPSFVGQYVGLECIIEVSQSGLHSGNVEWEWCMRDHLIQDFDPSLSNYGVVGQHPELLDFNYNNNFSQDWTHANGLDYNATLDQIVFSARHLSEIYIIDHSTTTAQASGSQGGNSGKGGDYLWRWGNPQVYDHGGPSDRLLFRQHDCKWVLDGYLDQGKISVFNNGENGIPSFVHLIDAPMLGGSYPMSQGVFLPANFDWTWGGDILNITMNQGSRSGCHALPDGAFMICETSLGRISEVSKAGVLRWSYVVPVGPVTYAQGATFSNMQNDVFRGERYPPNHPAFAGQTLVPYGIIENFNSLSDSCAAIVTSIADFDDELEVVNPAVDGTVQFGKALSFDELTLIDLQGKEVFKAANGRVSTLQIGPINGIFLLRVRNEDGVRTTKLLFQ